MDILSTGVVTVNPLLSPPGGYLFRAHLRGGGCLTETEGLFKWEKTMLSVLDKELGYKKEKLKYKKVVGAGGGGGALNR